MIVCGKDEIAELHAGLDKWPRVGGKAVGGELAWHYRETATEMQAATSHQGLVRWLRDEFGHLAHNKRIPGWMYGLPEAARRAFLDGYLSGDGWDAGRWVEATTVSPALAFGLRSLAASLGAAASVYAGPNRGIIEGRLVNARKVYQVRWRWTVDPDHVQHTAIGGHIFTPIREVDDDTDPVEVFNLSVQDDESYVADGIVVHNCTHFSRAKGGKPREKKIRGLAWIVVRWAAAVAPRVIALENVAEFLTWGPLDDEGQPIKAQAGETFREFVGQLEGLGYRVDWRVLVAADYGAPTSRKRLFLVARRDGRAILWPKPTHGPGRRKPWRTAAECIDWSIPVPSIFDRARPLAPATERRIAEGIRRYVLEAAKPFVMHLTHGGRVNSADEPLRTVTAAHRGEQAVVAPTLVQTGYGEREGQAPRVLDLGAPLGTVVGGGQKHGLVAAWLAKHYGGVVGQGLERPIGTVTGIDHHSLVTGDLEKDPTPRALQVAAFLTKYYTEGGTAQGCAVPLDTIVSKDRFGLVTVILDGEPWVLADIGLRMLQPRELATAQGFGPDYVLTGTKAQQVARIGNSVCPPVACAVVRAQLTAPAPKRAPKPVQMPMPMLRGDFDQAAAK